MIDVWDWLITLWIFRDPWGFFLAVVAPLLLVVLIGGGLDKLLGFREPAKRGGTGPVSWEEAQEIARREREKYHHG